MKSNNGDKFWVKILKNQSLKWNRDGDLAVFMVKPEMNPSI